MQTHLVFFSFKDMRKLYIPTLFKLMWLVLTNRLLRGSDMWHSKPKHIVAAVTVSSGEKGQMVQLWDNGDNINLGPWMTTCAAILPTHPIHIVWARKKNVHCAKIASLHHSHPILYTHSIHTFIPEKKKKCLLFCFNYSIISLWVLATERDWANVLRDQTVMTPRPLIWVFTESPISIFPASGKKVRKWKHLELIIFASCRNAFTELWFRVMPV